MNEPTRYLANLATAVAHSTVYFAREQSRGVELFAGGDPPAPTTQESMASVLQAYIENLPSLMQVTSQNILPTEQNVLNANKTLAPQQNQLALDLYNQFGKQFTQAGIDVDRQQALGQAGTDLQVLQGPGKEVARAALEAQREADPEYYKARELGLSGLSNLFAGLPDSRGGMTGGEREEITRSLAYDNMRRGNESPSNITTVENAMKFGRAGAEREAANQSRISQAVNTATQFLAPSQSKVDVFQMTTGKPSMNQGMGQFAGVNQGTGSSTFGMGSQLLDNTSQMRQQENQTNSQRRDSLDRFSQVMSSMPSVSCCWIFLAANGGELPWWVREARNIYGTDEIRRGYKRMSVWLVPLMQRSRLARWAVRAFMTEPLTMFAGYQLRVESCRDGWVFTPLRDFWFAVWKKLGTTTSNK
jgi:hypothetical protein